MSASETSEPGRAALNNLYAKVTRMLDQVSWSIVVLPMRVAAFSVFWRSGSVKLADWSATLELFRSEYKVPVLPPEIAAYLATSVELGCSTLLLIGLATRFAALAFLGMIAVIQLFVYPNAWPDHIQWLAFLFPLVMRGGGQFSADAVFAKLTSRYGNAAAVIDRRKSFGGQR